MYTLKMNKCYGGMCECDALEGFDFCKQHLIMFNIKKNNIRVTEDRVSYVAPISGRVILDDAWFRKNERLFRGWETKIIPSQSSYTWIFVYYMIKRIEQRLMRIIKSICARSIQKAWRRCISDPNYEMCRRRLMREASELIF